MRPMAVVESAGGKVQLIGVVKGLISEGKLVDNLLRKRKPPVVALGISAEELEGLRSGSEVDAGVEMTRYEENYAAGLSRFGSVSFPAPCFAAAVAVADELGLQVTPIDIPEEEFTDLYCREISTLNLMYHTARLPVLDRVRPKGSTAEEFAVWWDGVVEGSGGFLKVQKAREEHMAARVRSIEGDGLAFIEVARAKGVARMLGTKSALTG